MTPVLLLVVACQGATPIERAEQLYEKAKYERALKELGERCESGSTFAACERLRAFVLLALGRDDDARAAFHRLLVDNPDLSLGPDVAPKLQTLFNNAKRDILETQGLELEPIDTKTATDAWAVKVVAPAGVELGELKAFVLAAADARPVEVTLKREGDVWVGSVKATAGAKLRYFLVAKLASGVEVPSGSESAPLVRGLSSPSGGGVGAGTGVEGDRGDTHGSPFTGPQSGAVTTTGGSKPLPQWAIWSIVGGAVVLVLTGVALAIVLTRDQAPGTVHVNIHFSDEP
ncbi:MAG: hypothetical protein HY903_10240 [Deltaproteobacteria bacterium]|nr:hypothetical protein [Deltaproteobacteria bacterium]